MGLFDGLKKIVGATDPAESLALENDNQLKAYTEVVKKINDLEDAYEKLSNEQLREKTGEFRVRIKQGESIDSNSRLLIEAFAVAREASWRILKLRHYDVQVCKYLIRLN